MSRIDRFAAYAGAFEKAFADDDWSVVEPFFKLYNQGMIQAFAYQDARGAVVPTANTKQEGDDVVHAETGERLTQTVTKMSKRYGNVVNLSLIHI